MKRSSETTRGSAHAASIRASSSEVNAIEQAIDIAGSHFQLHWGK
jgi:hypothetical protein